MSHVNVRCFRFGTAVAVLNCFSMFAEPSTIFSVIAGSKAIPVGAPLLIEMRVENTSDQSVSLPTNVLDPAVGDLNIYVHYSAPNMARLDFEALDEERQLQYLACLKKSRNMWQEPVNELTDPRQSEPRISVYTRLVALPEASFSGLMLSRAQLQVRLSGSPLLPRHSVSSSLWLMIEQGRGQFIFGCPGEYALFAKLRSNDDHVSSNTIKLVVYDVQEDDPSFRDSYLRLEMERSPLDAEMTLRDLATRWKQSVYGRLSVFQLASAATARFFAEFKSIPTKDFVKSGGYSDVKKYCETLAQFHDEWSGMPPSCLLAGGIIRALEGNRTGAIRDLRMVRDRYAQDPGAALAIHYLAELELAAKGPH